MKRIFALLLCLGLALFLGCAGAEQATGLTPAQEARVIALAAGLTCLSQEQAAALSLTVEASAAGESIRFRCPQEPAYELLSQLSIGVDRRGIFRFSQPLHTSDEPVQYASEQAERERLGQYLETALSGLLQAPGADYSDIRPPEAVRNGDTGENFPFRMRECFFVFKPASAHPLAGTIVQLNYCPEYAQLFTMDIYPLD